jgi:hypothetical protein
MNLMCNNSTWTSYMVLYAYVMCLRILASSRIPRSILKRQTSHFWGGSVTKATGPWWVVLGHKGQLVTGLAARPSWAGFGRMGRKQRNILFWIFIRIWNLARLWKFVQGDFGGIWTCGFSLKYSRLLKDF